MEGKKMLYRSLILILLFGASSVDAQTIFERRISINGQYCFSNGAFQNSDGSYYLFATQYRYIGASEETSGDPIVFKVSKEGSVIWSKQLNLHGDVVSVARDSAGNFIVNGIFWTDVAGYDYRFISHISKNIDSSWTENVKGNIGGMNTRDSNGHIDSVITIVADSFKVYIDNYSKVNHEDSVLITQNYDSLFLGFGLIKVSDDCKIKWSLGLDDRIDPLNIISLSDSGMFLLLGAWNPSNSWHGDKVFIAKMDALGNIVWNKSLDVAKNSNVISAIETDNGDIVAIGNSDSNSFILKFDKDGALQKGKKYSLPDATTNFSTIIRTQDHGCIIAGDILRPLRDTNEVLLLKLDSTFEGCNLSGITCSVRSDDLISTPLSYHTLRDSSDNRVFTSALKDPLLTYHGWDMCSDNSVGPSIVLYSHAVYPNPVAVGQTLHIPLNTFRGRAKYTITISDVLGAIVHSEELWSEAGQECFQIPVIQLLSGSYTIDVKENSNSMRYWFKFIKE
jgi:hypothetical protein